MVSRLAAAHCPRKVHCQVVCGALVKANDFRVLPGTCSVPPLPAQQLRPVGRFAARLGPFIGRMLARWAGKSMVGFGDRCETYRTLTPVQCTLTVSVSLLLHSCRLGDALCFAHRCAPKNACLHSCCASSLLNSAKRSLGAPSSARVLGLQGPLG